MVDLLQGVSGITIYHQGPPLHAGPLPALFYFALSGEESLSLAPYNQPAALLSDLPLRVFSLDLPFHGEGQDKLKAMEHWAKDLPTLLTFINDAAQNVQTLIDLNLVDSHHMAAAGLSRGAFMATHLAIKERRIKAVLGFAPLIKLNSLDEWKINQTGDPSLSLDLFEQLEKLIHTDIRYYIGNRDTRVGTETCFNFVKELTECAYQNGVRSPKVEMVISPSIGHKGHGTAPHIFADGAEWIKKHLINSGF